MSFKTIATELLWFLRGDTNIKYLVDNNCHIWGGDCFSNYIKHFRRTCPKCPEISQEEFISKIKTDSEFAATWGELGPIYGKQWRAWKGIDKQTFFNSDNLDERNKDARHGMFFKENEIDQIQNLINELKTNPDSRRLVVNAWNVSELDQMVLPPCHYSWQIYTQELSAERRYNIWFDNNYETGMERYFDPTNLPDFNNPYYIPTPTRSISLMWNQRSVDFGLGAPFNIASYGLLLEIIAKAVNMVPDELIGNLGDVHLYLDHVEPIKVQLNRTPLELPKIFINNEFWNHEYQTIDGWINSMEISDFQIENYQSHPAIKLPLSN
jgi:thymidylate synthase